MPGAIVYMTLQNENQMWKMIDRMTENEGATEDELLTQARRIAAMD